MTTLTRDAALDVVLAALTNGEPRRFQIGVVGYYIEGMPYSADGLSVGPETTPTFTLTGDGFACDAFFPPTLLESAIVKSNGIVRSAERPEIVRVTLEVKRQDVWVIAEFVAGAQHNLFLDPDTLLTRKAAFAREMDAWRRVGESPIQ